MLHITFFLQWTVNGLKESVALGDDIPRKEAWPDLSRKIWGHQCKKNKQTNKKRHFYQLGDSFLARVVLVAITSVE